MAGLTGNTKGLPSYYDDSSAALRLDHRAAPAPEIFDRGRLPGAGNLRTTEIAERAAIVAVERERRAAGIADLLARYGPKPGEPGISRKQAEEIYDREKGTHGKERRAEERAESRLRQIETLADMRKKPFKHGGSSKGRVRRCKKGTWICKECHLEFCSHRPAKAKGGRPATSDRHIKTHVAMSTATKKRLEGIRPSDALEIASLALNTGRPFGAVLQEFRARKGVGVSPAA